MDKELKPGKDYIGVGCGVLIVNDKNETLLLKRNEKCRNEAGTWSRPGGTVEFGETVEQALVREIKEELDVDLELVKFLDLSDHIIKAENQHWIAISYLGRIKNGEPKNMEADKHDGAVGN